MAKGVLELLNLCVSLFQQSLEAIELHTEGFHSAVDVLLSHSDLALLLLKQVVAVLCLSFGFHELVGKGFD